MEKEKNLNLVFFNNENDRIIGDAFKNALKEIENILQPIIKWFNSLEEEK